MNLKNNNKKLMGVFPLQNPFTDNSEIQQRTNGLLNLNTWDVAVALTNFDWTIFTRMHEVSLYSTYNQRHRWLPLKCVTSVLAGASILLC